MYIDKKILRIAGLVAVLAFVIGIGAFLAFGSSGDSLTSTANEPTATGTIAPGVAATQETPGNNGDQAGTSTHQPTAGSGTGDPTLTPVPPSSTPATLGATPVPPSPTLVAAASTSTSVAPTSTSVPASPTPNVPPFVVAVSPEDGAIGMQLQKATFVITFSEAMDVVATEASVKASEACIFSSEYAWNAARTVLTYSTCASFAPGTEFNLTVSQSARDASGVGMAAEFQAGYRVLRQATTTLFGQPAYDGDVLKPGFLSADPNPDVGSTEIVTSLSFRGNLSFDLSSLPANTTEIVSAELSVFQKSHAGAAYGATGSLLVRSFPYGTLDQGDYEWTCAFFCNLYQTILSGAAADGWKSATVTSWANEDWEQRQTRGSRSQYQLRFANDALSPSPANGSATFQAGNVTTQAIGKLLQTNRRPALEVSYLYP